MSSGLELEGLFSQKRSSMLEMESVTPKEEQLQSILQMEERASLCEFQQFLGKVCATKPFPS